jgi:hypothetical protein
VLFFCEFFCFLFFLFFFFFVFFLMFLFSSRLGFLSFVLPGFGVVIAVNPVGGSELVTCGGVGAAPCASLQAALGCDLFLDGVEVQIAEGVILKGPQNRNLPPISKRSVTFSGSPGATIDGEGSTVFTTDPSLDVGDGPVFQSLSFLNATMVFGSCGGTVKNCLFAGQGTTCGVVFNGAVPEGVQAVGLTVQGGSFSGSCGISATNGALTLESFAFNNGIGSTTAVVLRGVVQFSASVLEVTRWSGTVLDASAAIGTFSWAGGHVSNCLDNVLMRFGAGGAASLSGMTFSTNFGSVSVSNKTSLTATSCGFHNGASAPYVLLSGGSAVLRNCTFSSHTGSPALSCSGAAPADPAQLVVSDAVFVGNQNVVLARSVCRFFFFLFCFVWTENKAVWRR